MATSEQLLICPVCNQPVDIATAVTDANGKAGHKDCIARKLAQESEANGQAS